MRLLEFSPRIVRHPALLATFLLATTPLFTAPANAQCDPVQVGGVGGLYGDLLVSGDVAYATGANPDPGLRVFDLSDPANPVLIHSSLLFNIWFDVESVALSGTTLFANGGYFLAFDVSDPSSPTLLSQTFFSSQVCCSQTNTILVEGNIAYYAGSRFVAMDVTDPAAPVVLSVTSVNSIINSLAIEGSHAYIVSGNGLQVIDISNPASPTVLSTTAAYGTGLTVGGDYAYIATGAGGGLAVVDVSDPSAPVLVSSVPVAYSGITGGIYEVVLSGDKAFGKLVNSSGIAVFDVSDPTSPILENITHVGGGANGDIEVQDGFVYTTQGGQLTVFDASSCLTPTDSPPFAVAAGPASADEGQALVTLDGSGSSDPDGDALDYLWAQTAGTAVALSDPAAVQPTFTAPTVGIGGDLLSFELTVTANGVTASDTVDVIVVNIDSDDDGLTDVEEAVLGTDPFAADTDGDGLGDGDEVNTYETNPLSTDTDGDELTDDFELAVQQFGCPDPTVPDTDMDGLSDGMEFACGLDYCSDADYDGDGLMDAVEILVYGTSPIDVDSDDDGLFDGTEVDMAQGGGCPNPMIADSDGDTLSDGDEAGLGTDPCSADTDGDTVPDNVDDLPTVPGVTTGFLEDGLRALCADVEGLDLSDFAAPNNNARKGRRNAMCNKLNSAAKNVAKGKFQSAYDGLTSLAQKLDGAGSPPDWMVDGAAKTALHASVDQLAYLVSLEL